MVVTLFEPELVQEVQGPIVRVLAEVARQPNVFRDGEVGNEIVRRSLKDVTNDPPAKREQPPSRESCDVGPAHDDAPARWPVEAADDAKER